MITTFKTTLWQQFGASIEMFQGAVARYPEQDWQTEPRFYFIAYHTAVFLDYYLSIPVTSFAPMLPYHITAEEALPALAVDDVLPERLYQKKEVLKYIQASKTKCQTLLRNSTEAQLTSRWITDEEMQLHDLCPPFVAHYTVTEILLYNFRHVQHHVGQLNDLLRQQALVVPEWVARAEQ